MWSAGLLPRSANLGSVGLSLVPDPANSPSFPLAQVGLGMPQVSAGQLSLRHSLLANIINTPGSPLLILLTFLEIHVLISFRQKYQNLPGSLLLQNQSRRTTAEYLCPWQSKAASRGFAVPRGTRTGNGRDLCCWRRVS